MEIKSRWRVNTRRGGRLVVRIQVNASVSEDGERADLPLARGGPGGRAKVHVDALEIRACIAQQGECAHMTLVGSGERWSDSRLVCLSQTGARVSQQLEHVGV